MLSICTASWSEGRSGSPIGPLLKSQVDRSASFVAAFFDEASRRLQDTTRLGLATLLLAAVALLSALALRRAGASPPARLAAAVGLLVPGLISFTTVGRLWYLPGALLVAAGTAALANLRQETNAARAALDRNWTAILALFYVFLGATALGLAGLLGILGGLTVLAALALRTRLPRRLGLAVLAIAALPFALLAWWSVAIPVIGILLIATGSAALRCQAPVRPT